ncbi:MAG: helix-turn-helix transcriptional regulator [Sneathiella sp.]
MFDFRNDDADGKPNQIDIYVGKRLRMRRTLRGMSQAELGQALGLTFQQIQKYEQGSNRIGSSRLYDLAQILETPITYFFDDIINTGSEGGGAEGVLDLRKDPTAKRETLELVRSFARINDPSIRHSLLNLIDTLKDEDEIN